MTSRAGAEDLAIAGLVPLSTVDWPGMLCATVFLQGCPLACPYCQNYELIDPRAPGVIGWDAVEALLERRRGLLDGVVFTGGEALRQEGVLDAAARVRSAGFRVGIHTAGAYPARLERVLPDTDWVGLDIKALPEDYPSQVGADAGAKAWASLAHVVREAAARPGFSYEVRTTVYPDAPVTARFGRLVALLRDAGVVTFALQEARPQGTPESFRAEAEGWDMPRWTGRLRDMAAIVNDAGFEHVELRLASI